jgi:hypothetical protein
MATRAEEYRSTQQRTRRPGRVSTKKPKKAAWDKDKSHAAAKATHALEPTNPGKRPSRKSTRSSANRAKADAAFNITEETHKGAPSARARKSRAKGKRVRGHDEPS